MTLWTGALRECGECIIQLVKRDLKLLPIYAEFDGSSPQLSKSPSFCSPGHFDLPIGSRPQGWILLLSCDVQMVVQIGKLYNPHSSVIPMAQQPVPIKMVVVGDGCTGKTCVLISYTTDRFPTDYVPTVFDNYAATVKVDGKMVNLGLWDTAGQDEYDKLRPLAYPHCDVFFIVFSVVDPASFINARRKWFPELQNLVPNTLKIFVGNKIDLRSQYRIKNKNPKDAPIQRETAKRIIEEQTHCRYFQCSALTQEGLKEIFDEAMRMVIKSKSEKRHKKAPPVDEGCSLCSLI